MNDIGSLGVILLAGIALGPSVTGWVSPDNLSALHALSEVALGLILFSIGTVFEFGHFRRIGRSLMVITLIESALVAVLVTAGARYAGTPWPSSLLLGALAIETAAASTLMVLRECNAAGPLTEVLTGVFALDNLVCLITFNVVVAGIQFTTHPGGWSVYGLLETAGPLIWQIVGSAALGYIVGFLLAAWSARVVEHGERLILLAGCVLLCVGLSDLLHLSAMVTNLAVGATVANLSERSRRFLESLSKTDPPLYAIFFVLAGADLNLSLLQSLGLAGGFYVLGRLGGKMAGALVGTTVAGVSSTIRWRLPTAMCAQAGLAIGLTLSLRQSLPDLAPSVTAVVLAAVIVFELIGPFGVRWTMIRSGEAHPETEPAGEEIEVEP